MAQIEKLLAQEPLKPNTERAGRSPQSLVSPNFIPATARRRKALNHYAAARNIKSSEAMKLILRGWITKKPPLPKEELTKLGITSNQLAKLAQTGDYP